MAEALAAVPPVAERRGGSGILDRLRRDPLGAGGAVVILVLTLAAVLAPLLTPFDPVEPGNLVRERLLPPSAGHPLGTDAYARDVLSRLLHGARISLFIGYLAAGIAVGLGTLMGAAAGFLGGWTDRLLMRFTDMVLAFPRLVLLIAVVAVFGPSLALVVLVLGLTQWPGTARLVRSEVLSVREREYVEAARALGFSRGRILFRHVIPNVLGPVIVAGTLTVGDTIVLEAGLSFLGLGIQPPTPSWGSMINDGRVLLPRAWWLSTLPGLAIVVTVLAFNLVGDALRDALDPRVRR